jgi:WD40 repeat protein
VCVSYPVSCCCVLYEVVYPNMEWECLKCGTFNEKYKAVCDGCDLDRDRAISLNVRLKTVCDECGHKHRGGKYCHMFVELPDMDDMDDLEDGDIDIGGDKDDEEDEESDDDEIKRKKAALAAVVQYDPQKPLPTPKYAKNAGFLRCNCTEGMPEGSKRYASCPKRQYCGDIEIGTWDRLMDAPPQKPKILTAAQEEALERKAMWTRMDKMKQCLPLVLQFSELGKECPSTIKVCRAWRDGTEAFQPYLDMRNCVPYLNYRPHGGQVDAMTLVVMPGTEQRVLFTGGDRRILASDIDTGETLALITRDSGEIPLLFEKDFQLVTASSNGSIRMFTLSHVLSRTKLVKTVWEHSRSIRGMLLASPSIGHCKAHGIENHVCEFYTAAEDRRIIVWDQQDNIPLRTIESKTIRHASYVSLGQTSRHLIAGTSDASLFVFSKYDVCERDDVHGCSTEGSKKRGCLQVALRIPPHIQTTSGAPPLIVSLLCCHTDPDFKYPVDHEAESHELINFANLRLYAGDSTGQLTVWSIPEFVGIDYRPFKTRKLHVGCINAIANTKRNLITLGDDGIANLVDLPSLLLVKRIRLVEMSGYAGCLLADSERVKRKIKSIFIHYDEIHGNLLILGTSYGDIFVLPMGLYV